MYAIRGKMNSTFFRYFWTFSLSAFQISTSDRSTTGSAKCFFSSFLFSGRAKFKKVSFFWPPESWPDFLSPSRDVVYLLREIDWKKGGGRMWNKRSDQDGGTNGKWAPKKQCDRIGSPFRKSVFCDTKLLTPLAHFFVVCLTIWWTLIIFWGVEYDP
jgi:hypothetical protein